MHSSRIYIAHFSGHLSCTHTPALLCTPPAMHGPPFAMHAPCHTCPPPCMHPLPHIPNCHTFSSLPFIPLHHTHSPSPHKPPPPPQKIHGDNWVRQRRQLLNLSGPLTSIDTLSWWDSDCKTKIQLIQHYWPHDSAAQHWSFSYMIGLFIKLNEFSKFS